MDEELGGGQEEVDGEEGEDAAYERGSAQEGAPLAAPRLAEAQEGGEQAVRLELGDNPVGLDPRGVQPEGGQQGADEEPNT